MGWGKDVIMEIILEHTEPWGTRYLLNITKGEDGNPCLHFAVLTMNPHWTGVWTGSIKEMIEYIRRVQAEFPSSKEKANT